MRVLVTGGSGVIGAGVIPELLAAGHDVRLLTRRAEDHATQWPSTVQPFAGDVTDPEAIRGAAEGCDAVLHITGIASEAPPEATFDRVNVQGTRHLLDEAIRAGSPRFVYVSSLGAERGSSPYHASKRSAEALVQEYPASWAIVRPGNVYGPGDDVISVLLTMHRTLPAVPMVGLGDHAFQPIFYSDLGAALVAACERDDMTGVFELAGDDITTPAALLDIFAELTERRPTAFPIPEAVAGLAARAATALGMPSPLDESKFLMLIEHNVIGNATKNALTSVFGVAATPLREGLVWLLDAQPEQAPQEGVGALSFKQYWADIHASPYDAEGLMAAVRERWAELMPLEFDAEPGAPQEVVEGASLTGALPLRGTFQVRVEEVNPRSFTLATLRGHPLAGTVTFEAEDTEEGGVRFAITLRTRPATVFDWLAMSTLGHFLQTRNWMTVMQRVVALSQGTADGIHTANETYDREGAAETEQSVSDVINGHRLRDNLA